MRIQSWLRNRAAKPLPLASGGATSTSSLRISGIQFRRCEPPLGGCTTTAASSRPALTASTSSTLRPRTGRTLNAGWRARRYWNVPGSSPICRVSITPRLMAPQRPGQGRCRSADSRPSVGRITSTISRASAVACTPPARPIEQWLAEVRFELFHLHADRTGGDADFLRGTGQAAGSQHRFQSVEDIEVHGSDPSKFLTQGSTIYRFSLMTRIATMRAGICNEVHHDRPPALPPSSLDRGRIAPRPVMDPAAFGSGSRGLRGRARACQGRSPRTGWT